MQLLREINFESKATLTEATATAPKKWFLEGVFMQADVVNRNRRRYPMDTMLKETAVYQRDYIDKKRSVGELQHPSTPEINLDRASHIIESMVIDGKNFIGKAKILDKTPTGQIVTGLLDGGVQLGVSSRGMGEVVENNGILVVQPNYKLATIDIVYSPSAPDAFVNALLEGTTWVWNSLQEDTEYMETLAKSIKATTTNNLQAARLQAFEAALNRASK